MSKEGVNSKLLFKLLLIFKLILDYYSVNSLIGWPINIQQTFLLLFPIKVLYFMWQSCFPLFHQIIQPSMALETLFHYFIAKNFWNTKLHIALSLRPSYFEIYKFDKILKCSPSKAVSFWVENFFLIWISCLGSAFFLFIHRFYKSPSQIVVARAIMNGPWP